jgi:hypothetical protein
MFLGCTMRNLIPAIMATITALTLKLESATLTANSMLKQLGARLIQLAPLVSKVSRINPLSHNKGWMKNEKQ